MKWFAVALNTFREAIRDHILYNLLVFALLIIGGSILIANLTIGEGYKVITDVGLACISIFGVLIAIFVGIGLVHKEIERKTIYNILSKPIRRSEFLLGKYMGLMITITVNVILMTLWLLITLYFVKGKPAWHIIPAVLLTLLELMLITSIALLFSTFSTPTMSAIFTMAIFVIGHLTEDLVLLGESTKSRFINYTTRFLYYTLPNLDNFNIRTQTVHHLNVNADFYKFAILYWVLYFSVIVLIATFIFSRRNFQ